MNATTPPLDSDLLPDVVPRWALRLWLAAAVLMVATGALLLVTFPPARVLLIATAEAVGQCIGSSLGIAGRASNPLDPHSAEKPETSCSLRPTVPAIP